MLNNKIISPYEYKQYQNILSFAAKKDREKTGKTEPRYARIKPDTAYPQNEKLGWFLLPRDIIQRINAGIKKAGKSVREYMEQFFPAQELPAIKKPTPKQEEPVALTDIPHKTAKRIVDNANSSRLTIGQYLAQYLPLIKGPKPEDSVTAKVGNTDVTTLIDAQQIFDKTTDYLQSAKKSIQFEMFGFGNVDVDGHIWPTAGAENIEGSKQQQKILDLLVEKKKQGVKVQVILDAHKWYIDGTGNEHRHFNNMNMIKYLMEKGIDVVPYPRASQHGGNIQHVKFLAVDGKKAIIGGMNWGNHSPANHDACVAIETQKGKKNSEVDNLIMELFDSDWAFAWERLGKTKMVNGPLTREEQKLFKGLNRLILEENIEYQELVGELYKDEKYKTRYIKDMHKAIERPNGVKITPALNLPDVKPLKNPKFKILTNLPREYQYIGSSGSEGIGDYIKNRLETAESLRAELFVLSHFEIAAQIIKRHREAKSGGRPFDAQIIVDPGILEQFPYCRKVFDALAIEGVPIRKYKVNETINQRMHSKWAVFDNREVLIGSANWSAVGLENNVDTGERDDYLLYNELIDEEINSFHREKINEREKLFGFSHVFAGQQGEGNLNYDSLKSRRRSIKTALKKVDIEKIDDKYPPVITIETKNYFKAGVAEQTQIQLTKANYRELQGLMSRYKIVKLLQQRKKTFARGNHEATVAFENEDLAKTFVRQFAKDWEYSKPVYELKVKPGKGLPMLLNAAAGRRKKVADADS